MGSTQGGLFRKPLSFQNILVFLEILDSWVYGNRFFCVQSLSNEFSCPTRLPCFKDTSLQIWKKADGSIVVPFRPSSSLWHPFSRTYASFFVDFKIFSSDGVLEHGLNVYTFLGSKRCKGSVLAARFKFTRSLSSKGRKPAGLEPSVWSVVLSWADLCHWPEGRHRFANWRALGTAVLWPLVCSCFPS